MTPALAELGIGSEQAATFSSRVLAEQKPVDVPLSGETHSPPTPVMVNDKNHMVVDTALSLETPKTTVDEVSSPVTSKSGEPIKIPEIFTQPYREDVKYVYFARDPIKEKNEWLGPKLDAEGNAVGKIEGSVVGRTGQDVIYIHAGEVKEKMTKVTTYVRWDPENPNKDLLNIEGATSKLIVGDTGTEAQIVTFEQDNVANGREFSGWYSIKGELETVHSHSLLREKTKKDEKHTDESTIESNVLTKLPISIKHVPLYPPAHTSSNQDSTDSSNKNVLVMPIITVADTYVGHTENVGYLQSDKNASGGRPISGTVVGKKGELFIDENTRTRKVHTYTYVLKEPGNISLDELARKEGFWQQTNFTGKEEYVIESEVSVDDAAQYGYVFSAFEVKQDQEMVKAA